MVKVIKFVAIVCFRNSVVIMIAFEFGISIVLVFTIASSSYSAKPGTITDVGKLWIDTDAGGDDAVAILMAIEAEKLGNGPKVVGITCVNGNTDVDNVAMNVLKILKVVNRLDIPVYKGSGHPLLLTSTTDNHFGKDGFGDFYYPDPPSIDLIQQKHAVNAMIDLVKEHPGEVTLIALGPLTNVALAIRMCPSFLDELQQLIIMGGCTAGHGNRRPGMEFNFIADPAANYIVFNSSTSKPTILVPYDTTQRTGIPMSLRMSLSSLNNTKVWLINSAGARTLRPDKEYWTCADAVAMTVALTSGSIVAESGTYYLDAIYEGSKTSGMVIVDYTNITHNPANANVIQGIDVEAYKQLIFNYFSH